MPKVLYRLSQLSYIILTLTCPCYGDQDEVNKQRLKSKKMQDLLSTHHWFSYKTNYWGHTWDVQRPNEHDVDLLETPKIDEGRYSEIQSFVISER